MHLYVSDMHLADNPAGDPVSDEDLEVLTNELERLTASQPVTLVLLGDIIDLLRSQRWDQLWKEQRSAPWSGATADFANFVNGHAEATALAVVQGIRHRYVNFSTSLARLVDRGRLTVIYVPGNHDFMLDLSPRLRSEVREFLALANDPARPFDPVYLDASSSVYATHGHTFDRINHHNAAEGRWAFGDAVVLRLVNRFQSAVCEDLGCHHDTQLGRALGDLDNVAPLVEVPIYIRWVAEKLSTKHERKRVLEIWKRTVDELLALPEFGQPNSDERRTRTALKLSTQLGLAELVARLRPILEELDRDYSRDAYRIGVATDRRYRFVVFGHTHDPVMVPLSYEVGGLPAYYVNTGSWRRVVSRPRGATGPFVGARVAGQFVVAPESAKGGYNYRLVRQWQAA